MILRDLGFSRGFFCSPVHNLVREMCFVYKDGEASLIRVGNGASFSQLEPWGSGFQPRFAYPAFTFFNTFPGRKKSVNEKKKSWRPTYSMVLFVLKGKSIHKNIAFWNQTTSVKIQGETHFTAALVGEGKVDACCGSVFCFFWVWFCSTED